jgi:LysM repeat protein
MRSLRMLAPVSLGLFAVIFLIVVVSSLGGDSSPKREPPLKQSVKTGRQTQHTGPAGSTGSSRPTGPTLAGTQKFYVVKAGDTLSKIAATTGVEIEQLLTLNPSVDPQALVTGQKIKLRE